MHVIALIANPRPSKWANHVFTISLRNMARLEDGVDTPVSSLSGIWLLSDVSLGPSHSQEGTEILDHSLTRISPPTLPSCFNTLPQWQSWVGGLSGWTRVYLKWWIYCVLCFSYASGVYLSKYKGVGCLLGRQYEHSQKEKGIGTL